MGWNMLLKNTEPGTDMKIVDKTSYGGMLEDKYFLVLENGDEIQVRLPEFESYKIGDKYEICKINSEA